MSKIKAGSENKAEKSGEPEKRIIIATPADAVTSGVAAEMEDTNPSLIREIVLDEETKSKWSTIGKTLVSDFFKTLFRVFISPQAP